MNLTAPHPWDVTPREAMEIQRRLRDQTILRTLVERVQTVAGIDCSYRDGKARCVVQVPVEFPYVPGLLSFRETPAVLEALARLAIEPDVMILDGHGYAHPRRFGLACHVGVITDLPTIGCAKSRLVGEYVEPPLEAGHWTELTDGNEVIGAVVRSRAHVKPIFVSLGHRVDCRTAIEIVLACCTRYKLPETTRYAHRAAAGERLTLEPAPASIDRTSDQTNRQSA
jgi:deoxyribonuclease V